MFIGLLIAVFFSYRGGRDYDMTRIERTERVDAQYSPKTLIMALIAIAVAFVVQLWLGSMILGALAGFVLFNISGVVKWRHRRCPGRCRLAGV